MARHSLCRTRPVAFAVLLASALIATPALAAHRCTDAELDQFSSLIGANPGAPDKCTRALNSKKTSLKQTCSACASSYRHAQKIDAWIGKHPKCAADLHASRLHSAGHGWMKTYKKICP